MSLGKRLTGEISVTSTVSGEFRGALQGALAVYSTVGGLLKIEKKFVGVVTVVSTTRGALSYHVPRFVIADATISPVLVCTLVVSSSLESAGNNQPVLAHAVRASPVFTFTTDSLPIFEHSTRVNEELKLLTV